mmetsp:Transcript_141771/g.395280  ORF Transcript_141771/g.395280 Transcript_141771/m.395280 type:complete len:313 (-) Transcript_141771:76-1014(-)|eukprot:CAMPEP_0179122920 /NCGR_PEP_ID=MMETSP0796-20121207/58031_1 /TAXON_ID=73915 /ORGANISM="Pyrodinium bahamense, Strain pbaha01" /LENGTH=312 /DNA_ID=CAMNT_0020821551 /DNA_START=1 /DNA_END=939 /DNA_ORIENTATION=-
MGLLLLAAFFVSADAVRSPMPARLGAARKQHIVLCNAYADMRPARVELRAAASADRPSRHQHGALWTRILAYGGCEEYYVDLTRHRLLCASPGTGASGGRLCELQPPGAGSQATTERIAAALVQPEASSAQCTVRVVAFPRHGKHSSVSGGLVNSNSTVAGSAGASTVVDPAELAVIDAFTVASSRVKPDRSVTRLHNRAADEEKGDLEILRPLPPLDAGAVVRLEDKIEPSSIATEVVGSRALGLGHAYAVEPKAFHVLLEDLLGSRTLDWRDVAFESARAYVGVRMGRASDPAYPQRLMIYRCQDQVEEP